MTRHTKKSHGPLRAKLKAAAAKRPKPKRVCLDITKDRIRLGLLLGRLEQQALGELPKRGRQAMTMSQQDAAKYLVDKLVPKAAAPVDLNVSGTIRAVFYDPTKRPADYKRKGAASV